MPAPANDNFADRILLSGESVSTSGTTVDATKEVGEPDLGFAGSEFHSVWYEWVAPSNGMLLIDTTGSAFNTVLGVFTGDDVASLTTLKVDNIGFDGTDAALYLNVTEGVSYKIMVDGFNSASGSFVLVLELTQVCGITCANTPEEFEIGRILDGGDAELMSAHDVVVDGNYSYVAVGYTSTTDFRGLEIVDVSDPANPVHKSKYVIANTATDFGEPLGIAKQGNYIYLACVGTASTVPDISAALVIIDVSDIDNPTQIGFLDYGVPSLGKAGLIDVVVDGNYAYVTATATLSINQSVRIIDISNPASPTEVGNLDHGSGGALLSSPWGLVKNGNYLYVCASGSDAIEVVNVSNPASPSHAGSIVDGAGGATIDNPQNIILHNSNYLILTSFSDNAIEVLDITSPTAPVHYSRFDNVNNTKEMREPINLAVSGNFLFVTRSKIGSGDGMSVLNITDLANPSFCKYLDGDTIDGPYLVNPRGIYISGNYVYVTNDNNSVAGGLTILSIVGSEECYPSSIISTSACVNIMANQFTGLDHLEGETVAMLGDGEYLGTEVVVGGSVSLASEVGILHVGLPYNCDLTTQEIETP